MKQIFKPKDVEQKYYSIKQIAKYLGVSAYFLYSLVKKKQIKHYKLNDTTMVKFKLEDVEAWIQKKQQEEEKDDVTTKRRS